MGMGGGDGGSKGSEERFLNGDGPELRPIRDQAWSFQDHSYLAAGAQTASPYIP